MSGDYRYDLDQRRVTKKEAYRLGRSWAGFGWEMMARSMALGWASGGRMAETAAHGLIDTWAPSKVAKEVSQEYVNLALGLMSVPASSAGSAVAKFDSSSSTEQELQIERALAGAAPMAKAKPVDLFPMIAQEQMEFLAERAGSEIADFEPASLRDRLPATFLLPARVLDASQAWASWFVPADVAQELLEDSVKLGHQPAEVMDAFEPVSVGPGSCVVSLMATDYRASDFGVLREIGLTLTVSPRGAVFPDPGQIFIRLIVTDPHSLGAARQIWGIRKDYWDASGITPRAALDANYTKESARFDVKGFRPVETTRPNTLELDFPRLGTGRSDAVPNVIYSMVDSHHLTTGPAKPARSTLRRTGEREGTQFRGSVKIGLPENREKGRDAGCLCYIGMACLCDTLRKLGLDQRPPAANGWTEHMSGQLEEPALIVDQPFGNKDL